MNAAAQRLSTTPQCRAAVSVAACVVRRAHRRRFPGALRRHLLRQEPRTSRRRPLVLDPGRALSRPGLARHPRARAAGLRLRVVRVGEHRRSDHARAHGPSVRRARAHPVGRSGVAGPAERHRSRASRRACSNRAASRRCARRMGVGAVDLRYDLQFKRYNLVRPLDLQRDFSSVPGLTLAKTFGPQLHGDASTPVRRRGHARHVADRADTAECRRSTRSTIRRRSCAPSRRGVPLVVAGDGEGLVDAANVGLLDGNAVVVLLGVVREGPVRTARRDRLRRRARRHRLEPQARSPVEHGARQHRLHRAGGREAARRRPERRAARRLPRRRRRRLHGHRAARREDRCRPRRTGTRSPTRPTTVPRSRSTATSTRRGTSPRSTTRSATASARHREADHDRSGQPRAEAERSPRPLDHEGAPHLRRWQPGRRRSRPYVACRTRARRSCSRSGRSRSSRSRSRTRATGRACSTGARPRSDSERCGCVTRHGHAVRVDEVVRMPQRPSQGRGPPIGLARAGARDEPGARPARPAAHRRREHDLAAPSRCPQRGRSR